MHAQSIQSNRQPNQTRHRTTVNRASFFDVTSLIAKDAWKSITRKRKQYWHVHTYTHNAYEYTEYRHDHTKTTINALYAFVVKILLDILAVYSVQQCAMKYYDRIKKGKKRNKNNKLYEKRNAMLECKRWNEARGDAIYMQYVQCSVYLQLHWVSWTHVGTSFMFMCTRIRYTYAYCIREYISTYIFLRYIYILGFIDKYIYIHDIRI